MRLGSAVVWLLVLLVGGQLIGTVPPTGAAPGTVFAEGTITSIAPDGLVLATSSGSTQVKMTAQTRVSRRIAVTLDDIKSGDYIGASSRREADGSLTAVYVNIFPPSLRNQIPEGETPWLGGNVMTNAVVTEYVTGISGRTLLVKFRDMTVRINVPPGAEITRYFVTTRADLRVGRRVLALGTTGADGSLIARSIQIAPGR
jgi:hypothetical protein